MPAVVVGKVVARSPSRETTREVLWLSTPTETAMLGPFPQPARWLPVLTLGYGLFGPIPCPRWREHDQRERPGAVHGLEDPDVSPSASRWAPVWREPGDGRPPVSSSGRPPGRLPPTYKISRLRSK